MLRIANWDAHEVAQTRKCDRPLHWVAFPTKHDGAGFCDMIEAGLEHFGAFILLVQVAAKLPRERRGCLCDASGAPLTAKDIARRCRVRTNQVKVVEETIAICLRLGWIVDDSPETTTTTTTVQRVQEVGHCSTTALPLLYHS